MIVIDANLLLYAYDRKSPFHRKAKEWIEDVFSDREPVGLPWQSVSAFIRITTNAALPGARSTVHQAVEIVDSWLDQPNVRLLTAGDGHWILFRQMLLDGQARGPLASDAQLAAITIEYGGILQTTDRDFARFPGLRWNNPIGSLIA